MPSKNKSWTRLTVVPLTSLAVGLGGSLCLVSPAAAAPLPATYKASAEGSLVNVEANLLGLPSLASLTLGEAKADVDSSRVSGDAVASGSNLKASVLGLGLTLDQVRASSAPVSNPAARALASLSLPGLGIDLGAISGDAGSFYVGDQQCSALAGGERLISDGLVEGAAVTLPVVPGSNFTLADVKASTKRSTTKLVAASGGSSNLVSTVTSTVGAASVFGDRVRVEVSAPVTVTSVDGASGPKSTVSNSLVRVYVDNVLQTSLTVGSGQTTTINLGLGGYQGTVQVATAKFQDTGSATTAAASLSSIASLAIQVNDSNGGSVAQAKLGLGDASTAAAAPAGGIECGINASEDRDNDGLTDAEEATAGTNPAKADSDNDGLNDGAEVNTHKTDPLKADTDADGLSDGREVTNTKTDPLDADTDKGTIKDGAEVTRGSNPLNPADDLPSAVADTDGDGLTTGEEIEAGTNPFRPDSDGDGLNDGVELGTTKTNPMKADTDNDGLNDGREVNSTKTNPLKADTDGDGLTDGREVLSTKTNPLKQDTDGDTLTDGREVLKPIGHGYKGRTNPLKKDTDGDKLADNREVNGIALKLKVTTAKGSKTTKKVYTNPLSQDTDKDGLKDNTEVAGYKIKQKVKAYKSSGKIRTYSIGKVRSNPTLKDTDRDGLTDKQEKTGSKNKRFKARKTNPVNWDTDFGGGSDGKEVKRKSDPTNANSNKRMR